MNDYYENTILIFSKFSEVKNQVTYTISKENFTTCKEKYICSSFVFNIRYNFYKNSSILPKQWNAIFWIKKLETVKLIVCFIVKF